MRRDHIHVDSTEVDDRKPDSGLLANSLSTLRQFLDNGLRDEGPLLQPETICSSTRKSDLTDGEGWLDDHRPASQEEATRALPKGSLRKPSDLPIRRRTAYRAEPRDEKSQEPYSLPVDLGHPYAHGHVQGWQDVRPPRFVVIAWCILRSAPKSFLRSSCTRREEGTKEVRTGQWGRQE